MFRYGSVTRAASAASAPANCRAHDGQPIRYERCAPSPDPLASVFVPAYVSSPELTFGFMFALEDPERIAEVVRNLIVRKTVSVFRLARLSDDDGPPERYVVNWAVIPQISITTAAPDQEELRTTRTMLVNAFLSEDGEVSLYSAQSSGPA